MPSSAECGIRFTVRCVTDPLPLTPQLTPSPPHRTLTSNNREDRSHQLIGMRKMWRRSERSKANEDDHTFGCGA